MTAEEAISILERMLDEFCNEDAWVQECKDAVDMAIEALRKQPEHSQNTSSKQPDLETLGIKTGETCADSISRQDAIDVLDVLCQEHRYKIPGKRETYSQYNEAWQDALDRAEGAIFNLPSVQQWIPCNWHRDNENLPEECKSVLICIVDGNKIFVDVSYRTDYNRWERYGRVNVIAWMPLPEPYRSERRTDGTD